MTLVTRKFTLEEFKAWFEGFGEAIAEAPTPEQWAKIKAKVAEIAPAYTGIRSRELPQQDIDDFKRAWKPDEDQQPWRPKFPPLADRATLTAGDESLERIDVAKAC